MGRSTERRLRLSRRRRLASSALCTASSRRSRLKGFSMKLQAPARMASTALSTLPKAVTTTMGVSGDRSRTWRSTSMPPSTGILRSVTTTACRAGSKVRSPSFPLVASSTSKPMRRRLCADKRRPVSSSSISRMVIAASDQGAGR